MASKAKFKKGEWVVAVESDVEGVQKTHSYEILGYIKYPAGFYYFIDDTDFVFHESYFRKLKKGELAKVTKNGKRREVYPRVLKEIESRVEKGRAAYGETLHTNNGRSATKDALEEALDLVFYLTQKLMEEEDASN